VLAQLRLRAVLLTRQVGRVVATSQMLRLAPPQCAACTNPGCACCRHQTIECCVATSPMRPRTTSPMLGHDAHGATYASPNTHSHSRYTRATNVKPQQVHTILVLGRAPTRCAAAAAEEQQLTAFRFQRRVCWSGRVATPDTHPCVDPCVVATAAASSSSSARLRSSQLVATSALQFKMRVPSRPERVPGVKDAKVKGQEGAIGDGAVVRARREYGIEVHARSIE